MIWLLIGIIAGSVALDQLTKWLTVVYLDYRETVPLWEDVFHFTHVRNPGAAWGIYKDERWVFMVFSTVAIIGLLIYLIFFRPKSKFVQVTLAMIVGGGIGNMIDRIWLGYVIDFIDFTLINFAVFNIADCFITVGAFALMGYLLLDMMREMKQPKKASVTAQNPTSPVETDDDGTTVE